MKLPKIKPKPFYKKKFLDLADKINDEKNGNQCDIQTILDIIESVTTEYHIAGSDVSWIPKDVVIDKINKLNTTSHR